MFAGMDSTMIAKAIAVAVLYLFFPISVITYYFSRRPKRVAEVERTLAILKLDPAFTKAYSIETMRDYVWGLGYASLVGGLGLILLFFSTEIGLASGGFTGIQIGSTTFPQSGSMAIFGMAFFGAYLWSLQHIFRRYSLNDLVPAVYYNVSIRMLLSGVVAVVIFNGYAALTGSGEAEGGIDDRLWPALAFMIGMFPARGLRWLTDRLAAIAPSGDSAARHLPLEMIEGIGMHDVLRLEELGIDSCYDLALADFAPLALRTPYSSRQLVDWMLQAKLCMHFGESVHDLRQRGIRTVADLEPLSPEQFEQLAAETSATKFAFASAHDLLKNDTELKRLRELAVALGGYWTKKDATTTP